MIMVIWIICNDGEDSGNWFCNGGEDHGDWGKSVAYEIKCNGGDDSGNLDKL